MYGQCLSNVVVLIIFFTKKAKRSIVRESVSDTNLNIEKLGFKKIDKIERGGGMGYLQVFD